MCKTSVYEAVQAAAEKVPGMKRHEVFAAIQTPALGGDLTSVKCHGEWLPLGLAVDDTTGLLLTVDRLSAKDADTVKEWLEPVADAVHAELLVGDHVDAFKTVANYLEMAHQVCKGHVRRSTQAFIERMEPKVEADEDGSLAAIGVTLEQVLKDLGRLGELILSRQPEQEGEPEGMHHRARLWMVRTNFERSSQCAENT
jgi:hypothetical protein